MTDQPQPPPIPEQLADVLKVLDQGRIAALCNAVVRLNVLSRDVVPLASVELADRVTVASISTTSGRLHSLARRVDELPDHDLAALLYLAAPFACQVTSLAVTIVAELGQRAANRAVMAAADAGKV